MDDLEALLFTDAPPRAGKPKAIEVYAKERYQRYAADRAAAYGQFYNYCFTLAKGECVVPLPAICTRLSLIAMTDQCAEH